MLDYACEEVGLPKKEKVVIRFFVGLMFSNKLAEIYQDPYKNTN